MTPILQLESVNFLQKLNIFSQKKDAQVNWEGLTSLVPNVASPANRICKLLGSNSTSSHKKRRSSEAWRLYFVRIRVFQIRFDRGDGGNDKPTFQPSQNRSNKLYNYLFY